MVRTEKKATKKEIEPQEQRAKPVSTFCGGVDLTAWIWSVELQGFLITDIRGVVRFSVVVREEGRRWIFTQVDHPRQFEFSTWDASEGSRRQVDTCSREFIRQVACLWRVDRSAALGVLWRESQAAAMDDDAQRPLWAA